MIEKAKQANRYGMNFKLATAAKIREMLLSDEFLDALAKRISYNSGIWIPKVGDKVKVNCPGRIAHGKVGVIVEDDAAEYVVRVDSENITSRNLKCEDLEPAWAETANPSGSLAGKQGYFDDADGVWVDEPNPFDGRKIETANTSKTPNSSIPDPGPGYRLLSKDPPEKLFDTDEGLFVTENGQQWLSVNYSDGCQHPLVYYRRKIEPTQWIPKVGDKVRVNRPGRLSDGKIGVIVEGDAGEYTVRISGHNLTSRNLTAKDLEPVVESPADHIADADKKVPPGRYRLLDKSAKVEPRKAGDLFWSLTLADWKTLSAEGEQDANRDDWPACRKIEEPAKAPEPQYREPTYADLANGPIEVEVCYDNTLETNWGKRMLYAVLPANVILRFVCEDPVIPESIYRWKHARVKVR